MDCSLPPSSVHGILQGKNTRMGCHYLLQGIFQTQASKPYLLCWQADSLPLSYLASPTLKSTGNYFVESFFLKFSHDWTWVKKGYQWSEMFSSSFRGIWHHHDLSLVVLTLIMWLRYCLPSFSSVKLVFYLSTLFFRSKNLSTAHTQGERERFWPPGGRDMEYWRFCGNKLKSSW